MKTTKKLIVALMACVIAVAAFAPPTFSWYTHSASSDANDILYNADIPVSAKRGGAVSAETFVANSDGFTLSLGTYTPVDGESASGNSILAKKINLAPDNGKAVKYYKTILENAGSNPVYVDFETDNLPNNADFYIGTISPTLNEKAYASRAVRSKSSYNKIRVYFKTHNTHKDYWGTYTNTSNDAAFNASMTNDFNIAYKRAGGSEQYGRLSLCSGSHSTSNPAASTFFFDLDTDVEYFYFFNHWYMKSSSNREWNRTLDITTLSPGKLYSLTGNSVDGKYKEYSVNSSDNTNLVAVNSYYKSVRLSMGTGVFADIGLKKENENDPDFIPEYYGASITYSSSNTSVCTVSGEGLITPVNYGDATITTRITGANGDHTDIYTSVSIPEKISQVPIIKNVLVPAAENGESGRVEIDWYALNKSTKNQTMTTTTLYTTL